MNDQNNEPGDKQMTDAEVEKELSDLETMIDGTQDSDANLDDVSDDTDSEDETPALDDSGAGCGSGTCGG